MMPWTPKLLLPVAILIFWANLLYSQQNDSMCDRISRKGSIHIKEYIADELDALSKCANLNSLSFRKCPIQNLPDAVLNATGLESLDLSKTEIQQFPKNITRLKRLTVLDMSFTNLYFLPPGIAELKNLKTLILCGTHINSLPEGLEHLQKIDMRMIDLNRDEQESLRSQYPDVKIYFSSPCNCK